MIKLLMIHLKRKKKACGFCSVVGHITTGCPTKMNIGKIILKDKCSFRTIEMTRLVIFIVRLLIDQKVNIYVVNNYYVQLNHVQIRGQKLITLLLKSRFTTMLEILSLVSVML